jgi:hypothetical protein
MKPPLCQCSALAAVVVLLGATLAPLVPARADGDSGAFDPATVLPSPAPSLGEPLAFDMNRIITQQTQLLRYQATEYQRKVAEQRARAFVAAQRRAIAAARPSTAPKKAPKPAKETPSTPQSVTKKAPVPKPPEPQPEEPKVAAKPKELPRYIAVDTVKDKRASPTAKKVIMIWDTQSETLVGNNLYDVQNPPPVGAKTHFDTYSAEYIGAGL